MTKLEILKQLDRIPKIQMLNPAQREDLGKYLARECAGDDDKLRKFADYAAGVQWLEAPCLASFRNLAAQLFYTEVRSRGCQKCDYTGWIITTTAKGSGAARCECRGVDEKPKGNLRVSAKELLRARKLMAMGESA